MLFMLKRILTIGVVAVVAIVALSSCNKVEDNIYRAWELESMRVDDGNYIIWEFKNDGDLVLVYNDEEIVDTANFTISKTSFNTEIRIIEAISLPNSSDPNGLFKVEKINDEVLVLTRYEMTDGSTEGAYLRREFTSLD